MNHIPSLQFDCWFITFNNLFAFCFTRSWRQWQSDYKRWSFEHSLYRRNIKDRKSFTAERSWDFTCFRPEVSAHDFYLYSDLPAAYLVDCWHFYYIFVSVQATTSDEIAISWISSLGNTIKTLNLDGESSIRSREAHYIMSQNYNEETDCQLLNKDVESQQIVEKLQRLKKILLVSIAMFITFIIVVIFVIISSGVEMPETLGKLVEGVCPPGMDWLPDMNHCRLQEEYFQVRSWKIIFP